MSHSSDRETFVAGVLDWYDNQGRHDLPWRDSSASAYEVLVAEVMLQKTSAGQVLGAFESFVEAYPDPSSLAEAPEKEIAGEIAKLGLRKRAGHLRQLAKRIEEAHDGSVPDTRAELLEMKGVGEYTAASVLAHAFGEDVAAVDTNVSRVLSRAFDDTDVEGTAEQLVPTGGGSDFVHALIDLGAAVCTPSEPDCENCPVEDVCDYEAGEAVE